MRSDSLGVPRRQAAADGTRAQDVEGIGLSIVKRLCEMLDATIEMESVKGQGSTFRILFPRHYSI